MKDVKDVKNVLGVADGAEAEKSWDLACGMADDLYERDQMAYQMLLIHLFLDLYASGQGRKYINEVADYSERAWRKLNERGNN